MTGEWITDATGIAALLDANGRDLADIEVGRQANSNNYAVYIPGFFDFSSARTLRLQLSRPNGHVLTAVIPVASATRDE